MHINDLNKIGRFLYKIGMFKNYIYDSQFIEAWKPIKCSYLKIRLIHPLWLLTHLIVVLYTIFTEWVIEAWKDTKKNTCIY